MLFSSYPSKILVLETGESWFQPGETECGDLGGMSLTTTDSTLHSPSSKGIEQLWQTGIDMLCLQYCIHVSHHVDRRKTIKYQDLSSIKSQNERAHLLD